MKSMHPSLPRLLTVAATLGTLLAHPAYAQQEAEWRVINPVSPTVVPLYTTQPSPFLSVSVAKVITPTGPTPEELAHQQLLASTLNHARSQIMSSSALEPRLDGLDCNGALQGPLGWTALCRGHWIHAGAGFEVGAQASTAATAALSALTELDADSAAGLRNELTQRVAGARLKLTVARITSQSVVLGSDGKNWQLPIRQATD